MAKWNISRYNGFLRASKKKYGLSHAQSQVFYRNLRNHLSRTPLKKDLSSHPRISKSEASKALSTRRKTTSLDRIQDRTAIRAVAKGRIAGIGQLSSTGDSGTGLTGISGGGGGGAGGALSFEDFNDYVSGWDLDDYGYDEYDASADYQEG